MQQNSIDRVLASSNLTLFFSLPFRPAGRKNIFYNGHCAVGLDSKVYQVYNPQLLKSNFLFSVMPVGDWLFGEGKKWVERDPSSPKFRHVYLYKTCETRRTVVYAAGIRADETYRCLDQGPFRRGRRTVQGRPHALRFHQKQLFVNRCKRACGMRSGWGKSRQHGSCFAFQKVCETMPASNAPCGW